MFIDCNQIYAQIHDHSIFNRLANLDHTQNNSRSTTNCHEIGVRYPEFDALFDGVD